MVKKLNNTDTVNTETVFTENIIDLNRSNTIVSSSASTLTLQNLSSTLYREITSDATSSVVDIIGPTSQQIINHFSLEKNSVYNHRIYVNSKNTAGSYFLQFPTAGCLYISATTITRGNHIVDYQWTHTNLSTSSLVVSRNIFQNVNTIGIDFNTIFS